MNQVQFVMQGKTGKQVKVGTTKPFYDFQKRGWVTDAGIFPAVTPGEYSVVGHIESVTSTKPNITGLLPESVTALSATPTSAE